MKKAACFLTLVAVLLCSGACWAQRDSAAFEGTPWEEVERERDAIEQTILSGNITSGLVLSGSSMYLRKGEPDFLDIATSVSRAYAGLPLTQAESILATLVDEATAHPSGLGWVEAGLMAQASMKPEKAVTAFQEALKDEECCRIPLVYTFLGQSLLGVADLPGATATFEEAVRAASGETTILFQVRHTYGESMLEQGKAEAWQEIAGRCAESSHQVERVWGLQQQAQYAWYKNDLKLFEEKVGEAVIAGSGLNASTEWRYRFDHDKWKWASRHLGYAIAALEGASDGKAALDYESAAIDVFAGDVQAGFKRLEPWVEYYDLRNIDEWDANRQLWAQRIHLFYNNFLARLGRQEEAVARLQEMLPYARDNYHTKFEPHIYCHIGYCLMLGEKFDEAKEAFDMGLSALDVPGEVVDPNVGYYREGRIGKKARMNFVANYRYLLNRIAEREGQR
jgi:tetratricopeptide (TPR) repeat protein